MGGLAGYLGEALNDGTGLSGERGELDLAENESAAGLSLQGEADDFRGVDVGDTGRRDGDAEAGSDETEDGEPVGGFLRDLGAEAVFFEESEGLLEGAGSCEPWVVDEGLFSESGGGDGFLMGAGMSYREHGNEGLGVDGAGDEALGGVAITQQAGVEGAVLEAFDHFGSEGFVQVETDLGVGLAIGAEDGGEGGEHSGADKADVQRADFSAANAAGLVDVAIDVAERALSAFEEGGSGGGEGDGARGAVEERVAEDGFEFADLLGERRLREMETQGGAAEVEFFRYGDEVAEVAEFDLCIHIC